MSRKNTYFFFYSEREFVTGGLAELAFLGAKYIFNLSHECSSKPPRLFPKSLQFWFMFLKSAHSPPEDVTELLDIISELISSSMYIILNIIFPALFPVIRVALVAIPASFSQCP